MNRKLIVALLVVSVFFCTSCALLPKEEVLPDAPELVVSSKQHTKVPVTRDDLTLTLEEKCTYQAGVQEELRFELAGEIISNVFVKKGDAVTAGTLIAELECTALREQIAAEEKVLDSLAVEIAQTEERLGLYYEKCAALETAAAADPMYEFQLESAQRTCLRLYNDLEFLKKDLTVGQMTLDELNEQIKQRQIYAGMDGVVSYVMELQEGMVKRSYKGQAACRIADMNTARFTARVDKGALKKGAAVTIVCDEFEYAAKVTNVVPFEKSEVTEVVEIQLLTPDPSLPAETVGKFIAVLEERKNVLVLPESSVETLNDGKTVVYYLDDKGIRYAKEVEVGLTANRMVEIVSGLEEGELVVK